MADGIVASLPGDWAAVVKAVEMVFSGKEFILLAEDGMATEPLHFKCASSLSEDRRHPRGRAFDNQREVRWRESARGRFIITYLSEKDPPPANTGFKLNCEKCVTREKRQKLYGKWSAHAKDWVEVSVPGISRKYESVINISPPPNALQINAVDYVRNGLVQMTRFCEVKEYRED